MGGVRLIVGGPEQLQWRTAGALATVTRLKPMKEAQRRGDLGDGTYTACLERGILQGPHQLWDTLSAPLPTPPGPPDTPPDFRGKFTTVLGDCVYFLGLLNSTTN